jgi:hypothetical protein
MELAIAPPSRMPARRQLAVPVVVTFKSSKLKQRANANGGRDLSGVWAYLSLMNEDCSTSLAPPRKDLLGGNPAASIHALAPGVDEAGGSFAYAMFPGLSVTVPGRYCFRISIIDMK